MKKIILFFTTITALSIFSISESNAQFSAGLRLGVNASNVFENGKISSSSKFVPGLHIGPYFRMAFKEKYRVQIDLLFSTKGSVYKGTLSGSPEKYYGVPFYLDVPVMFNYKPVAGLYVEAGIQPSFALAQLNFSANTSSEVSSPSANYLKEVVFAPIVGLGYEFKKVSLGARSSFGGTNASSISSYGYTAKNFTMMATFGFKF